jgi:ribosomal protein L16 Arg81 hydroxylase
MLTLNHVEATHRPVSLLAQALERTFQAPVVGVYCANFRSDRGFNLHWDDREIFVLQIEGRKHWKVYQPTSDYPYWDSVTSKAYPTAEPVFDGVLEAGSLLYMPRGWWHVAHPLDEPSLHLSLVVKTPTGVDLIEWLGKQMKKYTSGRRDIPHLLQGNERASFISNLKGDIDQLWNEELIGEFLKSYEKTALPHPCVSLPGLTHASDDEER